MPACGCGTDSEIKAGCGIHLSGTGEADDDPYVISLDPAAAAGQGLKPAGQDCKLATKIVPGGGLDYDGDGAMYAADCVPEIDPSKVSVDALLQNRARNGDITGGYLGGGYLYKPQSTRASIEYATERGVDMAHLPVRPLYDGTPVVTPDPMLGRQNGNTRDFGRDTPVLQQSPARWRRLVNTAGVWNPATGDTGQPQPADPAAGWFGYLEANETGLLSLDEAMATVRARVPLVLELSWPQLRDEQGNPVWEQGHEPPPGCITRFLEHIKRVVRRYNATRYVIATTQWPIIPGDQPGTTRDALADLELPHTGPMLTDTAACERIPPNLPQFAHWPWVFVNRAVPPDRAKQYADAGRHVILYPITRHSDHENLVGPAGAIGVLSGDPEYTAGHLKTHPAFADYRYRKAGSTFWHSTIEHGLMAPRDEWANEVHPNRRGLMPRYLADPANPPDPDPAGEYTLGPEATVPEQPAYFVLQGWLSPIAKQRPEDEMGWSFDLSWWARAQDAQAEVLLCRATDAPFVGFDKAQDKTGYIVSLRGDAAVLVCWDPAANATVDLASIPLGSKSPSGWVGFRVSVRDDGITLALLDLKTGDPLQDPAPYTTAQEQDANKKRLGSTESGNRGGYVFFGRTAGQGGGGQPAPPPDGEQPPPPPPEGGGQQPPPPPPPDGGGQPPSPPPAEETYVVQSGDTLSKVAQKTGADQKAIQDANGIQNPDQIREGDTLKIPR